MAKFLSKWLIKQREVISSHTSFLWSDGQHGRRAARGLVRAQGGGATRIRMRDVLQGLPSAAGFYTKSRRHVSGFFLRAGIDASAFFINMQIRLVRDNS